MKTGQDLLETLPSHRRLTVCPACHEDISRTALVDLAYTFEVCHCAVAGYPHLVETIYHRECLTPNVKTQEQADGEAG